MPGRVRRKIGAGIAATGLMVAGFAQVAGQAANAANPTDADGDRSQEQRGQSERALASNGVPIGFDPQKSAWTTNDSGSVLGTAPCNGNTFCPTLLSTNDGGATWTVEPAPDLGPGSYPIELLAVEADGKTTRVITAYDENSDIVSYISYDGATWQREDFGQQSQFSIDDLAMVGDQMYAAVSAIGDDPAELAGTFYRASVGSDQWEEVPGVSDGQIADTEFAVRGTTGLALNSYYSDHDPETRLVTTVDGTNWGPHKDPCGSGVDRETWVAAGTEGNILLFCEVYADDDVDILSSSDAGQTFAQAGKFADLGNGGVRAVAAFDDRIALAHSKQAENGCVVELSDDGGQSWERTLDVKGYADDLRFTDTDHATVLCGGDEQDSTHADVYRTTDGGQTWQPLGLRPTGAAPEWLDPVSSSWTSTDHGYVLGWTPCAEQQYCAALVETNDGGRTWTEATAPDIAWRGAAHKRAELFFAERDGKSVGLVLYESAGGSAANESFATYDGGQTWQQEDFGLEDASSLLLDMSATNAYAYVAVEEDDGSGGPSAYSTTTVRAPIGADDWSEVSELTDRGTYADDDINALGDNASAYIGGDYFDGPGPRFLTTSDGENWTEREDPCGANATPYFMPAGNDRIYAFCASPDAVAAQKVMVSEDGGATFTKVSGGPDRGVSPQGFAAAGDTMLVGDYWEDIESPGCLVQVSNDGGKTFEQKSLEGPEGYPAKVEQIQLDADGTGTAVCTENGVAGGGVVSRTTDGGQTWQPLDPTQR